MAERHADATAHIRADIEETRARMGETIEAIGDRLNPHHLKAELRESVQDKFQETKASIRAATIGRAENIMRNAADRVSETGNGFVDTIRENPVPAALVGIGLGWLVWNGRQQGRHAGYMKGRGEGRQGYIGDVRAATPRLIQDDAAGGIGGSVYHDEAGAMERVRERADDIGETVRDQAGSLASRAKEAVSDVAERAQETAGNLADRAQDAVGELGDRAEHLGGDLRYQAHRVEERAEQVVHENPLAAGAVALAIGLAAGLVVPGTRREDELLGATRDRVIDRGKEKAMEAKDKAQRVAERVLDEAQTTVRDAAREQGLTS